MRRTGNPRNGRFLHRRGLPLAVLLLPTVLEAGGLDVLPVWGGRFLPDRPTELTIRLASPVGGQVSFRLEGGGGTVEYGTPAEAQRPLVVRLPAYPGPDGVLDVGALLPDGQTLMEKLRLSPVTGKGLAVALTHPAAADQALGDQLVPLPWYRAQDLPRLAAGYGPVGSLTLPPVALAELDATQARALSTYLADCGPLYLADVSPAVLERVRQAAGCGGKYVRAYVPGDPGPTISSSERPLHLPDDDESSPIRQIGMLLLPYPLLLLGLAGNRRLGVWLLLVPPGAALAYALLVPMVVDPVDSRTWAEMESGDRHYRFGTLLELRGNGRAQEPLDLPADAGLPSALPPGRLRLSVDDLNGAFSLPIPTALLETRRYRLKGAKAAEFLVRLERTEADVQVANAGPAPTPPGWLVWTEGVFAVPPLESGQTHVVEAGDTGTDPPPSLPIGRIDTGAGLLLPLMARSFGLGDERIANPGWLLVRASEPET